MVVAVLVWLAPPQLGGSTVYTSTVGTSMEPSFHRGDLALVRPAADYRVGDIVLYRSPVLQRPVLHRILVIQGPRYYFKGDNNSFVDPGYVTRDELLGKLWVHVPKVGRGLAFVGAPLHAGVLAGIAVLVLLLGGGGARRSRRRRRRGSAGRRPEMTAPRAFPRVHRPRRSLENIVAGLALVLGLAALVIGFATPVGHLVPLPGAYAQTGSFRYSSTLTRPDSAYPDGVVKTGQPVFLTDFETLDIGFGYRFASKLAHSVHGTAGLTAVLASQTSNWSRTYVLQPPRRFTGDVANVSGRLDLRRLRALTHQLALDTGATGATYTVTLQPTIRVRGLVGGKPIAAPFAPTLPFTFSDAVLALDVPAAATLPGASYEQPTAAETNASALDPVQQGSIPVRGPNAVTLLKPRVTVSVLRGIGLGLLGLAALAWFLKPLRKKREAWSEERRIAHRFGCVIVDVVSLESAVAASGVPTSVPDFASLASFARYLERPILHDVEAGSYATEDSGRLYVFRPDGARPYIAAAAPAPVPARSAPARAPRRRRSLLSLFGLVFAGAVAIALVTGFTAANTVPLSRAGVSKQALDVNQLAPALCAGIVLTKLVIATGATVTGTTANDLVLGRNAVGAQTLTGGGGDDCLVAGGNTAATINTLNGSAGGDVCIGAHGATNRFSSCSTSYTP